MTKHIKYTAFGLILFLISATDCLAQLYARPDGTIIAGHWTSSGAATLHEATNEVTPSDAQFALNNQRNSTTEAELSLSDVADPLTGAGHIMRFRMQGSVAVRLELYDGTNLIASTTQSAGTWQTFSYALDPTTEADNISNYNDLRFKIIPNVKVPNGGSIEVSWMELEVPVSQSAPTMSSPYVDLPNVNSNSATIGATIDSNGGASITAHGTVWGTSPSPAGNSSDIGSYGGGFPYGFSHLRDTPAMPPGTLIYFRGFATNSVNTTYSSNGSFYTEPATQASGVNFSGINTTDMTVNWSRGSGAGLIVVMKANNPVDQFPADGSVYTPSNDFTLAPDIGGGNRVVYTGTGISENVTNLTPGTTYHVAVYEYAGSGSLINYKLTGAGNTASQLIAGPPSVSTPYVDLPNVDSNSATIGATIDSNGGASITAHGTLWGTSAGPAGNSSDIGAYGGGFPYAYSHLRDTPAMPPSSLIYFRGFAANSFGTTYSSDGTFYTEADTQASVVNFTNVTDSGMQVNWTAGSGSGSIVVVREDVSVNADPVDGNEHTPDTQFAAGANLGSLNYVVYRNSGTSVNITGLTPGYTYYVAVYAYSGSGTGQGGINYLLTGTGNTGSRLIVGAAPVSTPTVTNALDTSATLGATINNSGGGTISEYGTVWSTSPNPTVSDNKIISGSSDPGSFPHVFLSNSGASMPAGSLIYFKGYAVNAFATSYSQEASFYTEPSLQASEVIFSGVYHNSMTISWTPGSGWGHIVVVKVNTPVDVFPSDGVLYAANNTMHTGDTGNDLGSGNFVVYLDSDRNGITLLGLLPETTYHAAVYSYIGWGTGQGAINYKLSGTLNTGSRLTGVQPSGHNASFNAECLTCHLHASVARGQEQEDLCKACHNPQGVAADKSDVKNHNATVDCGACHVVHNIGALITTNHLGGQAPNLFKLRPDVSKYVASAIEPMIFQVSPTDFAFDLGDPPYNGPCQTCHTDTKHHRNNAAGDNATVGHDHPLGPKGPVAGYTGDGELCVECHKHGGGFAPIISPDTPCISCHGPGGIAVGARRDVFNDYDQTSHHVRDETSATIPNSDCLVCHMEPDDLHMNGVIDLRDPDTGTALTGFTSLSRNTAVSTIEPNVTYVQNNFCLKCHDGNGAQAQATPMQPFSTGYTVPNVFDRLDPTNMFHHAVRASVDNNFCNASTMESPWDFAGPKQISCFDCHVDNAHGGSFQRNVRENSLYTYGANPPDFVDILANPSSDANLTVTQHGQPIEKFCSICHSYDVYVDGSNGGYSNFGWHPTGQGSHGAHTSSNEMGCFACHGGLVDYSGISTNGAATGLIHGQNPDFVWPSDAGSNAVDETAIHFLMGGYLKGYKADYAALTLNCYGGTCNHNNSSQNKSLVGVP